METRRTKQNFAENSSTQKKKKAKSKLETRLSHKHICIPHCSTAIAHMPKVTQKIKVGVHTPNQTQPFIPQNSSFFSPTLPSHCHFSLPLFFFGQFTLASRLSHLSSSRQQSTLGATTIHFLHTSLISTIVNGTEAKDGP